MWDFIRHRFGPDNYEHLHNHFQTHEKEDGLEAAWLCLTAALLGAMEQIHRGGTMNSFPHQWLLNFAVEEASDEEDGHRD